MTNVHHNTPIAARPAALHLFQREAGTSNPVHIIQVGLPDLTDAVRLIHQVSVTYRVDVTPGLYGDQHL